MPPRAEKIKIQSKFDARTRGFLPTCAQFQRGRQHCVKISPKFASPQKKMSSKPGHNVSRRRARWTTLAILVFAWLQPRVAASTHTSEPTDDHRVQMRCTGQPSEAKRARLTRSGWPGAASDRPTLIVAGREVQRKVRGKRKRVSSSSREARPVCSSAPSRLRL